MKFLYLILVNLLVNLKKLTIYSIGANLSVMLNNVGRE